MCGTKVPKQALRKKYPPDARRFLLFGLLMHAKTRSMHHEKRNHQPNHSGVAHPAEALPLPYFNGFPYISTRIVPSLYHIMVAPKLEEPRPWVHIVFRVIWAMAVGALISGVIADLLHIGHSIGEPLGIQANSNPFEITGVK
jgi:hypothetical protein